MAKALPINRATHPVRKPGAKAGDLSRRAWLEAGQALLKEGGLRALKLKPLARRLSVTTGSFYHHFSDFDAYQGLLAAFYSGEQIAGVLEEASRGATPLERILDLTVIVARDNLQRLGLAMRAWAESDARARAAVEAQDAAVLGFVTDNLRAMGYSEIDARVRGYALVAVGVDSITGTNGLSADALRAGLLELICGPGITSLRAKRAAPARRRTGASDPGADHPRI